MSVPCPNRPPLDVAAVCIQSRWRLVVSGELDVDSGRLLVDAATVLAEARVAQADLDLAGVEFIDRGGWRAVGEACRRITDAGGTSCVTAASPCVRRLSAFGRPACERPGSSAAPARPARERPGSGAALGRPSRVRQGSTARVDAFGPRGGGHDGVALAS